MPSKTRPKPVMTGEQSVERLLLDPLNHRLPTDLRGASQEALLQYFIDSYNLVEIATSIADNGFFDEEPLLTVDPAEDEAASFLPDNSEGSLLVIEGNRRLATLKVLTGSAELTLQTALRDAAIAVREAGWQVDRVPVRQYHARADLLEYLGFRHVSGLMQWEAEAKARYVYDLVHRRGMDFRDVARAIGSRSDAVRRQYIAWSALEQAKGDVDTQPFIDRFGVFYRSLQNPGTRTFLRLQGWLDADAGLTDPLHEDGVTRLGELGQFMFGPRRVLRESRQLDDLGAVLADDRALAVLRAERSLELALQELPTEREQVFAAMRVAYRQLGRAMAGAFEFAGDVELQTEAGRLERMVQRLITDLAPQVAEPAKSSGSG